MNTPTTKPQIPFIDLQAQRHRLGDKIDAAVLRVINQGAYILGPEVKQLEADLSAFCGAREVVSCSNGTDALLLVLMAKGVGPGDVVICPSFTFAATAEVVALTGATPLFVDVRSDTFNMDGENLKQGLAEAKRRGLTAVGIIPVDLFGQPADYDSILAVAAEHGLWVLCDAAQSFGATYQGRKLGTIGLATSTSFYPAKPLGCYGDGGAVFTDDAALAGTMRSLRVHGEGSDRYDNVRIGLNGRMDTIQAAILIEKLKIFPDEIAARNQIAARYSEGLTEVCTPPAVAPGSTSVWAQYTIRIPGRDRIAARLKEQGIPTAIYYPTPLHRQTAYKHYPIAGNALTTSDALAREVLSLPMHPYLAPDLQDQIIAGVIASVRS
jgi:dTDP-4-amino-4,6-dideoxygalactose transaminase